LVDALRENAFQKDYLAVRGLRELRDAVATYRRRRHGIDCSGDDVLREIGADGTQSVDMRPPGRFAGTEPEPRAGLRGGHVPGSRNVPYVDLVDRATGLAIDTEAFMRLVTAAGVDPAKQLVGTCGSGTSACAFAWLMARAGHDDVAIYDGSWSEWGGRPDLPIDTGPPDG